MMFKINDNWDTNVKDVIKFRTEKLKTVNQQASKINVKNLEGPAKNAKSTTQKKLAENKGINKTTLSKMNKKNRKTGKGKLKSKRVLIQDVLVEDKETMLDSNKMSLAERLRINLKGGHFRFLNEELYTTDGASARKMFEENPDDFAAYHEGYRHQVEQWPLNPLDRIIKYIQKTPQNLCIADFGCGEGRLAKSVPHKVYSIDLLASSPDIIACDMANTPLEDKSIDIAIYCLSLMGTNIGDFILEANRVLKLGGTIYIAEIASRFQDVGKFISKLSTWGFDLIRKDLSQKIFYFFILKKVKAVDKTDDLDSYSLKPCLYKKR